MSRIETTFAALKKQDRKALIPFVTAGFPYADITPDLMHGMAEAGADIVLLASGSVERHEGRAGIGTHQVHKAISGFIIYAAVDKLLLYSREFGDSQL